MTDIWVEHSPKPELAHQSFLAYQFNYDLCCLQSGFLHARLDLLEQVYCAGLFYIETNNRVSLYAEAIATLLPKAKFLHLIRHPAEFVRSGMRRGYYQTMPSERVGHLMPNQKDEVYDYWNEMGRIERIAWQWETINREIRQRTAALDPERFKTVLSHDLYNSPEIVEDIFHFIKKTAASRSTIEKYLDHPVNIQRMGNFPKYNEWADSDKKKLARFAPSARKYGFRL